MVLERCPCCTPQVSWKLHWQCMRCGSLSSCSIRVHTAIRNERRQLCEHRCLRNKRPHHDHLPSLIISRPQLMRLRRSGITLILSINNLQRCRRYRKKPYHENIIPAIWLSGIYPFNERRIFKSLSACKSTLFRGFKSQKPNRRNNGMAKWSANM